MTTVQFLLPGVVLATIGVLIGPIFFMPPSPKYKPVSTMTYKEMAGEVSDLRVKCWEGTATPEEMRRRDELLDTMDWYDNNRPGR